VILLATIVTIALEAGAIAFIAIVAFTTIRDPWGDRQ
jgi:hypothetical protein